MDTKNIWDQVMALKPVDSRHQGIANDLTNDEIETIAATVDFFGGSVPQVVFDLKTARYRVFDWLAMSVQGRMEETPAKVLAYSFLKSEGNIDKFITDLRETDYECDTSWEELDLER